LASDHSKVLRYQLYHTSTPLDSAAQPIQKHPLQPQFQLQLQLQLQLHSNNNKQCNDFAVKRITSRLFHRAIIYQSYHASRIQQDGSTIIAAFSNSPRAYEYPVFIECKNDHRAAVTVQKGYQKLTFCIKNLRIFGSTTNRSRRYQPTQVTG
jgi:hypothetical protein